MNITFNTGQTVTFLSENNTVTIQPKEVKVTFASNTVGLTGATGATGPINTESFLIASRFSELSTQQARIEARQNLELQDIDCGTFN